MAHRSSSPRSRGKAGTATKGYQGGTLRSREEGSAPVAGLPLDGAAHRRHESSRRVLLIDELPAVAELTAGIEDEEVGSANGSIGLRGLLRLIVQIGEIVPLPLRSLDHVSEVVLGIAFLVVRVDRHELDAFGREIFLDRDRAILPRLHIGAVVAPEGNDEDRLVLERA